MCIDTYRPVFFDVPGAVTPSDEIVQGIKLEKFSDSLHHLFHVVCGSVLSLNLDDILGNLTFPE